MGESGGSGSKSIPSWQLPEAPQHPKPTEAPRTEPFEGSVVDARAALIEKASKFLDDEDTREASQERKKYFLQRKGLTDQEIRALLAEKDNVPEVEEVKGIEDEQQPSTTQTNAKTSSAQPADVDITDDYIIPEPTHSQKQDGLPIITYPEFLLHSQRPPPLITTDRLLTALYLASGAAATMYGLSNYLIEPMVETLSSARHSFFENASSNIGRLNEKLEKVVSKIPDGIPGYDDLEGSDDDSASTDPARFFSRTIATQTSPNLSRSSSSMSLSEKSSPSAIAAHASQILKLHELLSHMKDEDGEVPDPVRDNVQGLREYLQNLPSWGRTGSTRAKVAANRDDSIAKVKAEIKSVKGTLLSARNFPASISSR